MRPVYSSFKSLLGFIGIDVTKNPKDIFNSIKAELEKKLILVDYRNLDPFQKDHCIFICKKKN